MKYFFKFITLPIFIPCALVAGILQMCGTNQLDNFIDWWLA